MAIDTAKLDAFMGRFVQDLGAVMHAATIVLGDRLGLYKALAERPMSAEQLAAATQTDARYVREWLAAQAASGYVDYDAREELFSLTEEQALALTVEGGPAFIPGAFDIAVAQFKAIPKMEKVFRTGLGFGWHEHDGALFHGTERFFRPGYAAHLVSQWIPAFDGLHDMGDPVGAARHVRDAPAHECHWMIVEPYAHDRLADNLNPVGCVFYSASRFICTPASRAQEVGLALGAQAGEARLREVITKGGFGRFRRAAETPFNLVFEARA